MIKKQYKNVFVTVGTTEFEALVHTVTSASVLEQLACLGCTTLTIQFGRGPEPNVEQLQKQSAIRLSAYGLKSSIGDDVNGADLVISHAGAGSCIEVLEAGKPLIVVVNETLMNNHQTELAERLSKSRNLFYCTPNTLLETLTESDFSTLERLAPGGLDNFMSDMAKHLCVTDNCKKPSTLQCPVCLKMGIQGSFFCNQDCFKGSWKEHKIIHLLAKGKESNAYNPWPYYTFTGKLRPYEQTPRRTVPPHIPRPDYADHKEGRSKSEEALRGNNQIKVLDDEEIEGMRVACRLGREVLDEAARVCDVGVTTDEIDRAVHEACIERDCYPSPMNYYNFPKSCCTSVNEVICHGIPDLRPLEDGDLCNVDVTVYHRGFHGDLNETFFVGNVKEQHKKLVQVTYEALMKAIAIVKPGERYREIGNVIQKHVHAHGFSVVKSYCGHGIHRLFHTAPNVPHYAKNSAVGVMKPGHCFTIEPMISEGTWRDVSWPDDWTAVTADGLYSAQFEQTLLVTESGCDILTKRRNENGTPHFMDHM
uniref:Methionine aminopeptidase n=1 Tax=Anopheles epiroticus TaxID=199890 RepID=A0A182PTT1_9DIPT